MSTFQRPPRLVEVHWIDSYSSSGWKGHATPENDSLACRTAGYLVRRDKRGVTLAMNIDEQGHTGEWMHIPARCIKRLRGLK